jgi:hypothetical protein
VYNERVGHNAVLKQNAWVYAKLLWPNEMGASASTLPTSVASAIDAGYTPEQIKAFQRGGRARARLTSDDPFGPDRRSRRAALGAKLELRAQAEGREWSAGQQALLIESNEPAAIALASPESTNTRFLDTRRLRTLKILCPLPSQSCL